MAFRSCAKKSVRKVLINTFLILGVALGQELPTPRTAIFKARGAATRPLVGKTRPAPEADQAAAKDRVAISGGARRQVLSAGRSCPQGEKGFASESCPTVTTHSAPRQGKGFRIRVMSYGDYPRA